MDKILFCERLGPCLGIIEDGFLLLIQENGLSQGIPARGRASFDKMERL